MNKFDQESVKGTDIEDVEELEEELQDALEEDGTVKVADTAEEITAPVTEG